MRDGESDGQRKLLVELAGAAGKECDRDEHGNQNERGCDDGAGDFAHGDFGGAARIPDSLFEMWRSTFSMTTMASSTTRPVARVIPKSVRVLIEKPKSLTKAKVPMSETGIVIAGISVLRQSLQEEEDDQDDDDDRFGQRLQHFTDGFADGGGGVEGDLVLQARRKFWESRVKFSLARLVDVERIGVGELLHADTDGFVAVIAKIAGVTFCA